MNAVFRVVTRIQDQDDFSGNLTDGQFLKYNSSTNSFELQSVSPGGNSGQLQYNNSGAFAGVNHSSIGISGDIFKLNSLAIGDIPLVIKGFVGQTGNLTEWRDDSNNVLASVGSSGSLSLGTNSLTCGAITASGTVTLSTLAAASTGQFILRGVGTSTDFGLIVNNGTLSLQRQGNFGSTFTAAYFAKDGQITLGGGFQSSHGVRITPINHVVAIANGINAQCFLINKSYTSDSSQEALMLDAGKQVAGNLGLYSYKGSAGGSNYPIQIGMLAADGSTFSGLTVGTNGQLILPNGMICVANNSYGIQISGSSVFPGTGNGFGYNDNAYDLGLSASRFRDLWLSRNLYCSPVSSVTLATNGQFSIEMTSNTAGNLVYRGSDGTTRRMGMGFDTTAVNYLPLSGGSLTGALVLPNGTTANPSIDFTSQPGTGLLWDGANVTICRNNSNKVSVGSSNVLFQDGILRLKSQVYIYGTTDNILQQRNTLNAQCHLINKSYTSDSSQEALMLDAGKQISGKLGLYSYCGSAGGSNYPIQIGMLAANGTTFSGMSVATDGTFTRGNIEIRTSSINSTTSSFFLQGGGTNCMQVTAFGSYHIKPIFGWFAPLVLGDVTNGIDMFGKITQTPPSSVTLATNGQFSVEMTSDTAGNLVYRGSDGTTRRMGMGFDTTAVNYLPLTGGTLTGALSLGDNALTAGTVSNPSGSLVLSSSSSIDLKAVSGATRCTITGTAITPTVVLRPNGNNTLDLGQSGLRWATVYGVDGNFSGALTCGAITASGVVTGNKFVATSGQNTPYTILDYYAGLYVTKVISGAGLTTEADIHTLRGISGASTAQVRINGTLTVSGTDGSVTCGAITASGNLTLQNSTTAVIATLEKTYTSATNREYISFGYNSTGGAYDVGVSMVGSAGGSNRNLRFGRVNSSGYFGGLMIDTNGKLNFLSPTGGTYGYITANGPIMELQAASSGYPVIIRGNGTNSALRIVCNDGSIDMSPVGGSSVLGIYTGNGGFGSSTTPASILCAGISASGQLFSNKTYTSSTNFERLNFGWNSTDSIYDAGVSDVGSAGGSNRSVRIGSRNSAGTFAGLTVDTVGNLINSGPNNVQNSTSANILNTLNGPASGYVDLQVISNSTIKSTLRYLDGGVGVYDFYIDSGSGLTKRFGINSAGVTVTDNLSFSTVGKFIQYKSGTGQRAGNATLVAGTITVTNTTVTANTIVMLTRKTSGGTIGNTITYTVSAGASFTITSDNILDTSVFSYELIEVV